MVNNRIIEREIYMAKYLIVNADDFGMCHSANVAVFDLFKTGNLLSSTIMMPCGGAEEAVKFAIENPQYAIGVHLTLTAEWQKYRWKPLTNAASLMDEDGFMWHESDMVEKHAKYKDVEREIRAQIDAAHAMGMKPSHIDNHMGSLYGHNAGRISFLKMTMRVMGEYGYAYRLFTKTNDPRVCPKEVPFSIYKHVEKITGHYAKKYNVIVPDYLLFPDWTSDLKDNGYEHYREEILKIWTNIPEGVTETFVHPSIESDEIKGITNIWWTRVWEYQLMKDPYTHEYLESHGVKLISYRDLIKMRKG